MRLPEATPTLPWRVRGGLYSAGGTWRGSGARGWGKWLQGGAALNAFHQLLWQLFQAAPAASRGRSCTHPAAHQPNPGAHPWSSAPCTRAARGRTIVAAELASFAILWRVSVEGYTAAGTGWGERLQGGAVSKPFHQLLWQAGRGRSCTHPAAHQPPGRSTLQQCTLR